ncbi:2-methylcitrate dehydratase PrpD [Actinoplanes lutulentus]|uniref:2-methylcitrate dehydratase PrpD n=1 Tax=Actinoplanes lutulentus TaxID=1287878 RepID=A0A327Z3H7_9ACTN|nr:MmgE/PrpD family protein [Actinoplanes lutulentus]MBB2946305.1 2-methylcitrate dehydratase PrpD [Actinoplanes lutulentus]RAK28756.1 2-methylcitrate dehydratase PrpD [Actinoplanes lutulentus]
MASTKAAAALSRYAVATMYSALPEGVAERTKMLIYDQLACGFVGGDLPAGKVIARFADAHRGVREAAVFGLAGCRAPAALAALANGTCGHADEFDSVHSTPDFIATGHPAPVIVPAAVAVAERQSATGAELVNAVALGYDTGARVVSATGGSAPMQANYGLYAGSLYCVGAAFAASRLLGLDQRHTLYAAALALNQGMSGYSFFAERRHMSKALFTAGQAAAAGVSGAMLASLGFEGTDDVFEGRGGILPSWGQPGREGELVRDLGREFAVMGANFKFYSAGYPIHAAVEAALMLKERYGIDLAAIAGIHARLPEHPAGVVDDRGMPTISLQHMLGVALVAGRLGFDEAHSAALQSDPEVLRLKSLVTLTGDPDFEVSQPRGAVITIHLTDGTTVEQRVEHPKGHRFRDPQPGWGDLQQKWNELLISRIGAQRTDEFYRACRTLETIDDTGDLVAILVRI